VVAFRCLGSVPVPPQPITVMMMLCWWKMRSAVKMKTWYVCQRLPLSPLVVEARHQGLCLRLCPSLLPVLCGQASALQPRLWWTAVRQGPMQNQVLRPPSLRPSPPTQTAAWGTP
jgi:hypothetical protein